MATIFTPVWRQYSPLYGDNIHPCMETIQPHVSGWRPVLLAMPEQQCSICTQAPCLWFMDIWPIHGQYIPLHVDNGNVWTIYRDNATPDLLLKGHKHSPLVCGGGSRELDCTFSIDCGIYYISSFHHLYYGILCIDDAEYINVANANRF